MGTAALPRRAGPSVRPPPRSPAPLWPYLLLCAVLAVWVDLGSHHQYQNADSIVPILTSLQKWTLFYWEQRRFGMLVPLLATPFQSPLSNLLVQNAISIFAALAAGFLLSRYFVAGNSWPLAGLLNTALFLGLSGENYRGRLLGTAQPYGPALALAFAGLLLARDARFGREQRGRIAAALLALLLAHWLSPATAVLTLALVWLPYAPAIARNPRRAWRAPDAMVPTVLVIISAAIVRVVSALYPYGSNRDDILAPDAWLGGWQALVGRLPEMLGNYRWLAVACGLGLAGLVAARVRLRGSEPTTAARDAAFVLVGAALIYGAFVGCLEWVVVDNKASPRYLIPSVQLLQCAAAIAAVAPWLGRDLRVPRSVPILGAVVTLLAAAATYGTPSLDRVRSDLRSRLGHLSDEVLAAHCTHLAGDYWQVWPAVFHVNMLAHEAGRREMLWGVSFRSAPTREKLRPRLGQTTRVCVLRGSNVKRARKYGLITLPIVERRGLIDVHASAPSSSTSASGVCVETVQALLKLGYVDWGDIDPEPTRSRADLLHTNSIQILDRDVPALRRRGDATISIRNLDMIAVVDPGQHRIVWSWGPAEVENQHQPTLLDNGHLLGFDNGPRSPHRRAVGTWLRV